MLASVALAAAAAATAAVAAEVNGCRVEHDQQQLVRKAAVHAEWAVSTISTIAALSWAHAGIGRGAAAAAACV